MAGNRPKNQKAETPATDDESTGSLKLILGLTLLIVAVALGLMAWNTHQASQQQELRILQRDALLAGERLNKRADRTIDRLEQELRSGARISGINAEYVGVDELVGLNAAVSSADEDMAGLGAMASDLISSNQRLGLLDDGRFVLVYVPIVGTSVIATVDAGQWIPPIDTGARLVLTGKVSASFGDKSVVPPDRTVIRRGLGISQQGFLNRSASACVGIGRADFGLCMSKPNPLLTMQNGIELSLYVLLLAAPTLAIFGLYGSLSGKSSKGTARSKLQLQSNEKFELASANAGVGFWDVRTSDASAWVNEEAARLLGMNDYGDVPLGHFYNHIYTKHRDLLKDAIDDARPSQPFIATFSTAVSAGESWMEVRGSQNYRNDDDTAVISGVIFDVTESVRAREKQKHAESRLRNAIESFPCPFALWDHNKRLSYWNRAFETSFDLESVLRPGVGYETVMLARSGKVISERTSPDDSGVTLLGLRNGEWVKLVERATPAGGLITFGLDVTNDVRNEDQLTKQKKKLKGLVQELERSEGHNAELARKYNDERAKAERSADSKSAFLANMSHELRTPLNAINGFSEILVNEMYGPLGDRRYGEYAQDILTSGQHLLDMINDILDIAKIEAGKMTIDPKPIDLVDPVDAAVRMIRRKSEDKGIQLSLQAEDALPEVDADHRAVRQMVLNLLSNAIKFTDAGGRIHVAVQQKDNFVRIAVRDTGVGIPKEHLPRLAQPFEQVQETRERNYEGTGLGLALTKSFAEMHGGRFTIASEMGKGTMVSIYLPVSTDIIRSDRNVA